MFSPSKPSKLLKSYSSESDSENENFKNKTTLPKYKIITTTKKPFKLFICFVFYLIN